MKKLLPATLLLGFLMPGLLFAQTLSPSPSPAEVLPRDGFSFWREQTWLRIQEAFTFQAERKATLLERHLDMLDRKLDACLQLGDEDCVKRIEERIEAVKQRAQRYLERKAAVLAAHKERFEKWQAAHAEHLKEIQERLQSRTRRLEQRLQNREKLIELRSPVVRQRLNATEQRVEEHRQETQQLLESN